MQLCLGLVGEWRKGQTWTQLGFASLLLLLTLGELSMRGAVGQILDLTTQDRLMEASNPNKAPSSRASPSVIRSSNIPSNTENEPWRPQQKKAANPLTTPCHLTIYMQALTTAYVLDPSSNAAVSHNVPKEPERIPLNPKTNTHRHPSNTAG